MNSEPMAGQPQGGWARLLANRNEGLPAAEMIWWYLGAIVVMVGAFSLIMPAYLGVRLLPVWISWVLIAAPIAALLWWLVIVSTSPGNEERRH